MHLHGNQIVSGTVIGAAIDVHRNLGPGADEIAYEEALSIRLTALGHVHACQYPLPLLYKGETLDCGYRADVLVEGQLLLELKSVERILPIHEAQLLTYMRLGTIPVGFLINFAVPSLRLGLKRRVLGCRGAGTVPRWSVSCEVSDLLDAEIASAASEVQAHLGPGLLRSAYEECLCHELGLRGVPLARGSSVPLVFDGHRLDCEITIPLVVDDRIPVCCMCAPAIRPLDQARLGALIRHAVGEHGVLLNFGAARLSEGMLCLRA